MNNENIKTLISHLENLSEQRINMSRWFTRYFKEGDNRVQWTIFESSYLDEDCDNECGTAACIAGWAAWLYSKQDQTSIGAGLVHEVATSWLGLDIETADKLFYPPDHLYTKYSKEQVLSTLNNLLSTGKVVW